MLSRFARCLWAACLILEISTMNLNAQGAEGNVEKRQAELARLLRILPKSEAWEKWLQETKELPPDFDSLPRVAGLPDPLQAQDGKGSAAITNSKDWPRRKEELLKLCQRYIIGAFPPPPGNVRAKVSSTREEAGATVQEVQLEFGPDHKAKLSMELLIPKGQGPFPVFLTQHNHRGWALVAVSRGYIGCVYAGADSKDDTAGFIPVWPECDWTKLTRRAWAGSRCIDYLETLPIVDSKRIGITGHSRNGKLSIIAAAIDERIAAMVSSSSGAGGACAYRFFSEAHFGEGIELLTRQFPDWMHPRLRFFAGREDRLPVDQHDLIAAIAPRGCLIATALNDPVESTWAIQQTYLSAKRVYDLLGAPDRLRIAWRHGSHETAAADIQTYLDWFDTCFGRGKTEFPEVLLHPRYEDWLRRSGEKIDANAFPKKALDDLLVGPGGQAISEVKAWAAKRPEMRRRIQWGLGEEPPAAANPGDNYGSEPTHRASLLGRPGPTRDPARPEGITRQSTSFGDYVSGDLYFPASAKDGGRKLPAILWLHPHSFSNGYVAGYRRGEQPYMALAKEGFAVFAYDAIGNGYRIEEAGRFYERHPRWSLMGKMVRDARAAVDVMEHSPVVDPNRIYVVGYGPGASVGLHAAALDERIAGVVSVAGFTPMRLDTPGKGTGGIARLSQWHVLQPRLGAFVGDEARIPYDYHEVLALIAPRGLLVVTPQLDRENTLEDVKACLQEVRKVYALYGAAEKLQHEAPDDYNRLSPELQKAIFPLLRRMAGIAGN